MAMQTCITCAADATVIDSRKREGHVYRRYRCDAGHLFVTTELPREEVDQLRKDSKVLDIARRAFAEVTAA